MSEPPAVTPRPLCGHCGWRVVSRARHLCFACSRDSDVRALYPSTSKFGRRGLGTGNQQCPLPPEPTDAIPGTPAKVAILEERARLGFSL